MNNLTQPAERAMALMVLASIKSHTLASLAKNKYGPVLFRY